MKRSTVIAALLAVALAPAGPALAQQRLYLSADVPTDPDGPPVYLPSQVILHEHLAAAPFSLELGLPGDPTIDGLHKMDTPGYWLFSFESPTNLAGLLAADAEGADVVLWDGFTPALFHDASCVSPPVPPGSNVDALYLSGGDAGSLVVSYDVPTALGPTFQPSALVRWKRTGPGPCDWALSGLELDAAFGTYFPGSANVIGAHRAGGRYILAFDIPVDIGPPGLTTNTPGQIVTTDGVTWNPFFDDLQAEGVPGWPISSLVDGLACEANPGRIDAPAVQILLGKSLPSITVYCPGGCSSGGVYYGLYQGTIASINAGVYNHVFHSCSNVCPGGINFVPPATSTYYLVVPHNGKEEGSYGRDSALAERPQAVAPADRCVVPQNLTPCP
jgi:hypothetical protein